MWPKNRCRISFFTPPFANANAVYRLFSTYFNICSWIEVYFLTLPYLYIYLFAFNCTFFCISFWYFTISFCIFSSIISFWTSLTESFIPSIRAKMQYNQFSKADFCLTILHFLTHLAVIARCCLNSNQIFYKKLRIYNTSWLLV